jgi:hypothetical protein
MFGFEDTAANNLYKAMLAKGVAALKIHFSGGNDEGGNDERAHGAERSHRVMIVESER